VQSSHDLGPACLRCVGPCPVFLITVSLESSSIDILDQLCWRLQNKGEGLPEGLCGKIRVEVHSLGWYRLGRRELGTWIIVGDGKPVRA
jgi:hypothetical protein